MIERKCQALGSNFPITKLRNCKMSIFDGAPIAGNKKRGAFQAPRQKRQRRYVNIGGKLLLQSCPSIHVFETFLLIAQRQLAQFEVPLLVLPSS